jgi:histone-lysine N-methyltransferase SETMAR
MEKGLTAPEACHEIRKHHGPVSADESTVRRWYGKINAGIFSVFKKRPTGRRLMSGLSEKLVEMLESKPKSSTKFLSAVLGVSPHTVQHRLTDQLEMKKVSVRWIPHSLTSPQIQARKEGAKKLGEILSKAKATKYQSLLTGDETWIYLNNSPPAMWVPKDSPRPTVARKTIASPKVMMTVFFSGARFWHISVLPQKTTMTGQRFVDDILHPLQERINKEEPSLPIPVLLHYDNARCHCSKFPQNSLLCSIFLHVQAPPYSPDISPCDFYLFGYVKEKLKGRTFKDGKEVVAAVEEISKEITPETLYAVFEEWRERCEKVASTGEYVK